MVETPGPSGPLARGMDRLGAGSTFLFCSFLPIWSVADPTAPFLSPFHFETLGKIIDMRYPDSPAFGRNTLSVEGFLRCHRIFAVAVAVLAAGLKLGWVLNRRDQRSVARSCRSGDDARNL